MYRLALNLSRAACGLEVFSICHRAAAQEVATLRGHTGWVGAVAFASDNRTLAIAGSWGGTVKVWDVTRLPAGK